MIVDERNQQWACQTCVNGHRAAQCGHTDRWLVAVKGSGRPRNKCDHLDKKHCDCDGVRMVVMVAMPNKQGCQCKVSANSNHQCWKGAQLYMTRVSDPKKAPDIPPDVREYQERLSKELNSRGPEYAASFFSQPTAKLPIKGIDPSPAQKMSASRSASQEDQNLHHWQAPAPQLPQISQTELSTSTFASPDTYFIPPGVATAQSPLTQPKFEQMVSLDQFSQPVEGGLEHVCTCQEACQCLGCPVHPFNRSMNAEVQQLAEQWTNTMPTNQTQRINMSDFSIFDYTAPLSSSQSISADPYGLSLNANPNFQMQQAQLPTGYALETSGRASCCMPLDPSFQEYPDSHVSALKGTNDLPLYSTQNYPTMTSQMGSPVPLQSPLAFASDGDRQAYSNHEDNAYQSHSLDSIDLSTAPSSCCSPSASQWRETPRNMQDALSPDFPRYGDPP